MYAYISWWFSLWLCRCARCEAFSRLWILSWPWLRLCVLKRRAQLSTVGIPGMNGADFSFSKLHPQPNHLTTPDSKNITHTDTAVCANSIKLFLCYLWRLTDAPACLHEKRVHCSLQSYICCLVEMSWLINSSLLLLFIVLVLIWTGSKDQLATNLQNSLCMCM